MGDLGRTGSTIPERYLAALIDHVFSGIVVMIVAAFVSENVASTRNVAAHAAIGFSVFGVYFAYFFFFEALISTTPGQLLFSLRIEHLDEAEKRAYILADNRLAEEAGWDKEILAIELQGLIDSDFSIELTGFDTVEVDFVLDEAAEAKASHLIEMCKAKLRLLQ